MRLKRSSESVLVETDFGRDRTTAAPAIITIMTIITATRILEIARCVWRVDELSNFPFPMVGQGFKNIKLRRYLTMGFTNFIGS